MFLIYPHFPSFLFMFYFVLLILFPCFFIEVLVWIIYHFTTQNYYTFTVYLHTDYITITSFQTKSVYVFCSIKVSSVLSQTVCQIYFPNKSVCVCECDLSERENDVFKILHSIEAIELGAMLNLIHGIHQQKKKKEGRKSNPKAKRKKKKISFYIVMKINQIERR